MASKVFRHEGVSGFYKVRELVREFACALVYFVSLAHQPRPSLVVRAHKEHAHKLLRQISQSHVREIVVF